MADLNEVRLIGRLTRDPELRRTTSGLEISNIGLAVNRRHKGQDGMLKEEVSFLDITFFGRLAEVTRYLRKGKLVFIGGRLKLDMWDDKNTGQKRSKLNIIGENIQFLEKKDDSTVNQNTSYEPYTNNNKPVSNNPDWSQNKNWTPDVPTYEQDGPTFDEPPF